MNLYRIAFKVKPTPAHPKYGEIKFGFLQMLLFDFFSRTAADTAEEILKRLPWEKVVAQCAVYNETKAEQDGVIFNPLLTDWMIEAYRDGFAAHLIEWPYNASQTPDESEFMKVPFQGEPNSGQSEEQGT